MKNGKLMAEEHHDDLGYVTRSDMTLRDWFAGQALTGIDLDTCEPEKCAVWVYKIADAMMEARKK